MKAIRITIVSFLFIVVALTGCVTTSQPLVKLNTRADVTQSFYFMKPEKPVAVLVELRGGTGKLYPDHPLFFNESRQYFLDHGFITVVVNLPSDRKDLFEGNFRFQDENVQDIKAIVSYMKKEFNLPVWLIGNCSGTWSATSAGIRLKNDIDGLALVVVNMFSAMHKQNFDEIVVPTIMVSNYYEPDACCTPTNPYVLKSLLTNSPRVDIKFISKGTCGMDGLNHCVSGVEKQMVAAIADFIKSDHDHKIRTDNQQECFDRSGAIRQDDNYLAYSNGVVKDTKTCLEWVAGPDKDMTLQEAFSWLESLSIDGGGWGMPGITDYMTLTEGRRNITSLLNTSGRLAWVKAANYPAKTPVFALTNTPGIRVGKAYRRKKDTSAGLRIFAVRVPKRILEFCDQ